MAGTTLTPADRQRNAALAAMGPELQKIALAVEESLRKADVGTVMCHYDAGARLLDMMERETDFEPGAMKKLARYLPVDNVHFLRDLKVFAGKFKKPYVLKWTEQPFKSGRHLTMSHWLLVSEIKTAADCEQMLKHVVEDSVSANSLRDELRGGAVELGHTRGGGRPPKEPSSYISGLHTVISTAQKLNNFAAMAQSKVFDLIDEESPDKVTTSLLKTLQKAETQLGTLLKEAKELRGRAHGSVARVKNVLSQQKKTAAPAEAEADAGDAPYVEEGNGAEAAPRRKKVNAAAQTGNGDSQKSGKKKHPAHRARARAKSEV